MTIPEKSEVLAAPEIEFGEEPRGPHIYLWSVWRETVFEPVYVGQSIKGRFGRGRSHIRKAAQESRCRWHRALAAYLGRGARLRLECYEEVDGGKAELGVAEIAAIARFGRREIDESGTLWNDCAGGEGRSSDSAARQWQDPSSRAAMVAAQSVSGKVAQNKPEVKAQVAEGRVGGPKPCVFVSIDGAAPEGAKAAFKRLWPDDKKASRRKRLRRFLKTHGTVTEEGRVITLLGNTPREAEARWQELFGAALREAAE